MKRKRAGVGAGLLQAGSSRGAGDSGEARRGLYHCNYCMKDISETVRVKCAVCRNVDLCLECFAVGVEIWPHKRTHAYKVVENLSFPLLSPDWGADEELLLLDAVSTFGLCNWKDISGHVGNRTAEQCRAHYHEVYVNSPARPLPDPSRVLLDKRAKVCAPSAAAAVPARGEPVTPTTARRSNGAAPSTSDGATTPGSPLTSGGGGKGNGGKSPGGHTPTAGKTPASGPGAHTKVVDTAGFNPKREDFEFDLDPEIEASLAELEIRPGDSAEEVAQKTRLLEIYSRRLEKRVQRRQFILEKGLLEVKEQQAVDRKRSKEERALHGKMRVFRRFQTLEEHAELVDGLWEEQMLHKRIADLKAYKALGVCTMAEVDDYEAERARRESERVRQEVLAKSAPYLAKPTYNSGGALRADRYLARKGGDHQAAALATGLADDPPPQAGLKVDGDSAENQRKSLPPGLHPLRLDGHPGLEALSPEEAALCMQARLLPAQFLALKASLLAISEGRRGEPPSRVGARTLLKVHPGKIDAVFDIIFRDK